MVNSLRRLVNEIQKLKMFKAGCYSYDRDTFELREAIEQAQKEWYEARIMLDFVNDPDLIDHVIFSVKAAEKKYMYLLKVANSKGFRATMREKEEQLIKPGEQF